MKKNILAIISLILVLSNLSFAQVNCEWAFNPLDVLYPTPSNNQIGTSIITDNVGNVYVTGSFMGSGSALID